MSVLEAPRPASSSSYFAMRGPRACRLLLRVHSAENLRHVSSHGTYCKIYVGRTEMVRGSRYYRQSHGGGGSMKLSASASAHNIGSLFASSFDGGRAAKSASPSPSASSPSSAADTDAADEDAPRMRVLKTCVQKGKRPNPVWDEKFDIPVADPARDVLSIRVKSARLMSSPSIGACAVSLKLVPGATVDQWVRLMDGRKDAGRIRLQMRLVEDEGASPAAAGRRFKDPAGPAPSAAASPEDSWLSLPDAAGPGPGASLPPQKLRRSVSAKAANRRRPDEDVPVRENGGSSTSNESEPASEDPRGPQALLVTPLPGARVLNASARRFRESRRRRMFGSSPRLVPAAAPAHAKAEREDAELAARRSENNLSGLDYGRSSAPTADSAPATSRVSFHSFVLPSSRTRTPSSEPSSERRDASSDELSDESPLPSPTTPTKPLAPSVLIDRGTMTLDELAKSRLQSGALAPRESSRSSRVHFDSDDEEEDDDDVSVVYSAPAKSPRRPSSVIFEDDEDVVLAHQEKLLRLTGSVSNQSMLSLSSLTPSVVVTSESLGDAMDASGDESDDESDDEDDDDGDKVDGEEEPRIPLNASLTKLLFRFSANVLIEEDDDDDLEEDDGFPLDLRPSDDFVPIMDFADHSPVDDVDCA